MKASRPTAAFVGFATAVVLMAGVDAVRSDSGPVVEGSVVEGSVVEAHVVEGSVVESGRAMETTSTTSRPSGATVTPDCGPLARELWRREEAGALSYEEYVDMSEDELDRAPLALATPNGAMADPTERPSYPSFGASLDPAAVPDARLENVVGYCWELGLLD